MRKLSESMEAIIVSDSNLPAIIENMCAEWTGLPYPELSVLLVYLKYVAMVHQNHHWIAKGDSFYGDHLLFERLYDSVVEEIDGIAEKVVGLGTIQNVDIQLQVSQIMRLVQNYGMSQTIPQSSELAKRSLIVEMNFLVVVKHLVELINETGMLTRGLDNLIAGIEDKHEGHVYLLKQRCLSNT